MLGGGKPLSDNNTKSKLLTQLQALRALAFVCVFICHTAIFNNSLECVGRWGVSVFFVLSGFVMVYSYYEKNRIKDCNFISNLKFSYAKLNRLWLLHILCTLVMMLFWFVGDKTEILWKEVLKFILNAIWIQEWIPFDQRSANPVSWFLCTIVLGYFIFPWFLQILEKGYSRRKALIAILLCLFAEIVVAYIGTLFPTQQKNVDGLILDPDLTSWLVYHFPLARIFDIIIGFNLGYLFVKRASNFSYMKTNLWELIGVVLAVLGNYYFSALAPRLEVGDNIVMSRPEQSWSYSLGFVFSSIILVYSFAMQNGFISRLLTNNFSMYLAKISPYGFLIHYVIFRYAMAVYYRIPGFEPGEFLIKYGCWLNLTVGFILTIVCCEIWMRLYARFFNAKKAN